MPQIHGVVLVVRRLCDKLRITWMVSWVVVVMSCLEIKNRLDLCGPGAEASPGAILRVVWSEADITLSTLDLKRYVFVETANDHLSLRLVAERRHRWSEQHAMIINVVGLRRPSAVDYGVPVGSSSATLRNRQVV